MPQYSKEQLLALYKDLPEDLQDALYSEQSAQNIYQACADNGITDSTKISESAKNVGYVLLGLLTPDEFQNAIAHDLGINNDLAKNISNGIKNSVFYPLKKTLETLYGTAIIFEKTQPQPQKISPNTQATIQKPTAGDGYRESIE